MTIDEQIEFYRAEYEGAKTKSMALVAFGAYTALVKLKAEPSDLPPVKTMADQIELAAARARIRNVVIP